MGHLAGRPQWAWRRRAANELGCSWHTVNSAVVACEEDPVDDDPTRMSIVTSLGFDDALSDRRHQHRSPVPACSGGYEGVDIPGGGICARRSALRA